MTGRRQGGIALITAILVVSVAVLAATALLVSGHLAMRRMSSLQDSEQAWWVVRGVEAWIIEILKQDNNGYDALNADEAWSQPVDYLPVEQGFLRGRIVDQQSMFNLNSLGRSRDDDDPKAMQFRRLLRRLQEQVEFEGPVPDLVPAIRDWIDKDQIPGFPGVEDSEYMRLDPPYRAANRPFSSISELRAVYGVSREIYQALVTGCPLTEDGPPQSCISALPGDRGEINVNTASKNVLMALSDSTDEGRLDSFLSDRMENPATTKADFKKLDIYANAKPEEKVNEQYDVKTEYFQIRGEVVVGSSRLPLYSLIRRAAPHPTVIAHGTAED